MIDLDRTLGPAPTVDAARPALLRGARVALRRNDAHLHGHEGHRLGHGASAPPTCPPSREVAPAPVREARAAWAALVSRQPGVSCGRCSGRAPGCCYTAVSVTLLEAVELVESHPRLVRERRAVIEAQAEREDQILGPMPDVVDVLANLAPGPQRDLLLDTVRAYERTATAAWFAERTPCPFLTTGGTCAVYHARPIGCALYAVVSPPALCAPSDDREVARIDARAVHARWLVECLERSVECDVPPVVFIGLARAVRAALRWVESR